MSKNKQEVLNEWKVRLTKAQVGHYKSCESYLKKHQYIGFSLVIISSILTGFLFLKPSNIIIQWSMAIASIVSTVLATLQIFMKPSEQAEVHRQCATKYGALRREVESFLTNNIDNDFNKFDQELRSKWDNIAEYAPITTGKIRSEVKRILQEEKKDFERFK